MGLAQCQPSDLGKRPRYLLIDAIEGTTSSEGNQVFFSRFGLQATGDNARVYRGGAKGEIWRFDRQP